MSYHLEWQKNRVDFMLSLYGPSFFKNKSVLELGPYNGYIGNRFNELGSRVLCLEGRQENVDKIRKDYPNLEVATVDLDTDLWWFGKFDIIINFGLFYHLNKFHEKHLVNCVANCSLMFFESLIVDKEEPILMHVNQKNDSYKDQALLGNAGVPSTSYVENIFKKCNCKYTKYCDGRLNGNSHCYDWVDRNDGACYLPTRRFWIVEK